MQAKCFHQGHHQSNKQKCAEPKPQQLFPYTRRLTSLHIASRLLLTSSLTKPPMRTLFLLTMVACSHTPRIPGPLGPMKNYGSAMQPVPHSLGEQIAMSALHYLEHKPAGFRADCSGFVEASAARAGAPIVGNTASFWELAKEKNATHRRKRPRIGDLAFFDDTHDRNNDGRRNDPLTHIAIVVGLEPDGTILMAHDGTSKGRSLFRMNLYRPDEARNERAERINDALRRSKGKRRKKEKLLAGELWRGFATPEELLSPQ